MFVSPSCFVFLSVVSVASAESEHPFCILKLMSAMREAAKTEFKLPAVEAPLLVGKLGLPEITMDVFGPLELQGESSAQQGEDGVRVTFKAKMSGLSMMIKKYKIAILPCKMNYNSVDIANDIKFDVNLIDLTTLKLKVNNVKVSGLPEFEIPSRDIGFMCRIIPVSEKSKRSLSNNLKNAVAKFLEDYLKQSLYSLEVGPRTR